MFRHSLGTALGRIKCVQILIRRVRLITEAVNGDDDNTYISNSVETTSTHYGHQSIYVRDRCPSFSLV